MVTFIRLVPLFNYNVVKARSLTQGITKQSGKFVHLSPTQPKIVTSPVRIFKMDENDRNLNTFDVFRFGGIYFTNNHFNTEIGT